MTLMLTLTLIGKEGKYAINAQNHLGQRPTMVMTIIVHIWLYVLFDVTWPNREICPSSCLSGNQEIFKGPVVEVRIEGSNHT